MKARGQVEVEAIIAIILIMVFFVAVSLLSLYRKGEVDFLSRQASALDDCYKVATTASYFSASQGRDEIFLQVSHDMNIGGQTIYVDGFFCSFYADVETATLLRGTVRVFEEDNVVRFENA